VVPGYQADAKFDFESLRVYQRSLEYVDFVFDFKRGFPKAEAFAWADQFRRAVVSEVVILQREAAAQRSSLIVP